jgi:hypothetical protein
MATFQFGARLKTRDFHGRPSEVGEYALHVQCAWRIVRGDQVVVGSQDLYYPADYEDRSEHIPEGFDWDRDPNRRDRLVQLLFEDGAREFVVDGIDVCAAGTLHIRLNDGFCLDVVPAVSLNEEHWRLFKHGADEPHFVIAGSSVET